MKFNIDWLREYISLPKDISPILIKDTLNNIGLEVENARIFDKGDYNNIVVAKILSAERHPNADKLQVCKVFDGINEYQIVCGASNARAGINVVLSKVGAIIPNGSFEIKKSKIRGVESEGMLCSAQELCLANESSGIIELPDDAQLGFEFVEYYKPHEKQVFEIKLTPNRGDAANIRGIARDLSAAGIGDFIDFTKNNYVGSFDSDVELRSKVDGCVIYGIEIRNVAIKESPQWLKERLLLYGINPKNIVVDALNYVMLDIGNPMHAYDVSKINGCLEIGCAKGNKFEDLKGNIHDLSPEMLTIQNDIEDLSLAGIIGGKSSMITDNTRDIFLEAAYFMPEFIAKTGQKLKITSDSRFRFERGVDISSLEAALCAAAQIILENCSGSSASKIVKSSPDLPVKVAINYMTGNVFKTIGFDLKDDVIESILLKLGFSILSKNEKILKIEIPYHRHDISCDEDITEEIARIYGYNRIASCPYVLSSKNVNSCNNNRIVKFVASLGYVESVTLAFADKVDLLVFGDIDDSIVLQNPIASHMNTMRNSLFPGLLTAFKSSFKQNLDSVAIFEHGNVFSFGNVQERHVSGIKSGLSGNVTIKTSVPFDIYDVKADLATMLAQNYNIDILDCNVEPMLDVKWVHPAKSFNLIYKKKVIASFGVFNPRVLKHFEIEAKHEILFFDVIPANIVNGSKYLVSESDLQSIVREFSFIVKKDVRIGDIVDVVRKSDSAIFKVDVLDIYEHDKIGVDNKSISFRCFIQPSEIGFDIESISDKIVSIMQTKFGAILRDGVSAT